ncbi:hypothetical protein F0919_00855 [Taibaiella lutea]|uniref:O-antigen ligase-related domain-containing protein n=1 Tax=Taibaiella lutea TaxID=2608001 RepID=A0A5M6CMK1_9BACT|nr:O-antigen ligase family protein [Taibaiella lutea]KAA5536247.1 hypothetical protein F0919_00855 [Taibaiella lutea]
MKYKDLRYWFKTKKLHEKIFLFFIVLRPIVEPFFYLKSSSPLLSPLYWLGFLTFIVSIIGIFKSAKIKSKFDTPFQFWSFLVIANVFLLYFTSDILDFIFFGLKLSYPVLVFFLLRTIIKSRIDLYGILTLFLYASILSMFWFVFDIAHYGSNLRDGSSFADIVNYGFYANFGLIILLYFNFKKKSKEINFMNVNSKMLIVGFIFAILCILSIRHMASIAVVICVSFIFVFYLSKKKAGVAVGFIVIAVAFLALFGSTIYSEVIQPRINNEIEVAQGDREESQALHGRMSRWEDRANDFAEAGLVPQLVGYPFTISYSNHMIGVTPHNDFLRILFFTGIIGIIIYVYFIGRIFLRIRALPLSEKYLATAAMVTYVLYSISTVPTFYPGFNNFSFTIIAFISLPKKILKSA